MLFFKSWVGNYKPKMCHFQNVSRTGSNLLYGMYNDEIPDSVEGLTSSTYGHTKGTLHDTGLTLLFHIYVFLNRCKFIYGRCNIDFFSGWTATSLGLCAMMSFNLATGIE